MKNKKQRTVRAGTKRKVPSDVSPSTSLPPLVEGQLRCFLRVTISRVLWTVHKPPPATFVRLRWWGESSDGTHFFPRDGLQVSQKSVKTTARFPIRCGPKQFTSYLTDMGSLVLEVLTKPDHLPIARAQVAGISSLSLSHPVGGFYTLVSPTSEKLGELQVSLNLEPLTEAYDGSNSGPATDMSVEGPNVATLTLPSQPISISADSRKQSVGSGANTPRGKDHLYFQNAQKGVENDNLLENQMSTTGRSQSPMNPTVNPSTGQLPKQTSSDILSVLLERGNKLRNAMVASALKCDVDATPALKDAPFPLPKDNSGPPSKPDTSPSGTLFQSILLAESSLKQTDYVATVPESGFSYPTDMDSKAVDLLLGSINTSPLPHWVGEGSSPGSLSGHSSFCGDSELNDPQYDQSLLENLFYKSPMPDTRPNDAKVAGEENVLSSQNQQPMQSGAKASEGPAPEHQLSADSGAFLPGLNADQLTLLNSVQGARVGIDSLTVPAGTTPRNASSKGKPPRPSTKTKCTFFVEYMFPVAITSKHKPRGGEVTRAVCSKVTGGVLKFAHQATFPVHFSKATIKQWWETDLLFKIYSRNTDQKKPVPTGKAVYPLRCLLQSKELSQSVVLPVQSMEGNCQKHEIGPLKVCLKLITENMLGWKERLSSQTAATPHRETQYFDTGREELMTSYLEDPRPNVWSPQKPSKVPPSHSSLNVSSHKVWDQVDEDPEVLLHTLLMVPDGKDFNCGPMQALNVYLNCKFFWCDEMARSVVSWGQANPTFSFLQVTPVALTAKLLERLKNNVMVIEVWQKMGSSGQDRLLGLVKLPLNQFYMSFRDPKIAHLLLQAQYPVLGVDSYMPVIDVFSGSCKGNLRVVMAMGTSEQIASLQRTRVEEYNTLSHLVRPVHLLDHKQLSQTKLCLSQVPAAHKEIMREHLFLIRVEKINGLTPLQSTVWGEADCYVQYSFPCQDGEVASNIDLIESSVDLKAFRTTTTLCVPDPVFSHTDTHVLLAPEDMPVQGLLLSSLSYQGLNSGAGVQFEVWCRYYYPNVRDQLVAKGLLPLSKLCAMVTMQTKHQTEAQMFSVPLIPRMDSATGHQPQPSGLLDVCIQYKHRHVRPEGFDGRGAASRIVTLVVQVHRASGLQAAARVLSEQDQRFSYFADVGVNTYVTVQLSFLPDTEKRCTRIAARTFCPEFEHHMEVSCDLQIQKSSGETCSLAEQLEEASAVFTLWNKDNRKVSLAKAKDVMLGSVKIPLADLVHKKTGISGWFGVYMPLETSSSQHQQILVGGLEISIKFPHHSDRERVLKAAQGLGWEMAQTDHEMQNEEEMLEQSSRKLSLTFSMPRAWIPVHCLLLPGHSELERSTYCYYRYKFYDQDAFCSPMKHPCIKEGGEEGQATVNFEGSRTVELRSTQPIIWYLREERLEVQVWVSFNKHKAERPSDTDRLVGSAFVDLSTLAKTTKQKLILSGVYPLFRRTAADLQGAALRVHITLTEGSVPSEPSALCDTQVESDSQEGLLLEEQEHHPLSPATPKHNHIRPKNVSSRTAPEITSVEQTEMNMDESFPVTVTVDQAMHLNLKGCPLAERSEGKPCCCVSYVTADSAEPVSTGVVASSDCPVWDHQHECRLLNQLLIDPQQSLVFKVWHKGDTERVLGFASVDLSPLLWGFPSVCGWYNIIDFSGQCHGQLKVSITPLKGVHNLRVQRKTVNEEDRTSLTLFQPLPVSYHTTATYSSFPSHISRYPEQMISSPDQTNRLFPERPDETERHFEHMDNVRLYHQSLQEQVAAHSVYDSTSGDVNPSTSFLFSTLRKKLGELDNIQRYFSRKLSTPTFPSMTAQDHHTRHEEERKSETDTSQLLFKSNHLVGEVNNIISGLQQRHLEMIPSNLQSTCFFVGENNTQSIPESESSPCRASNSSPVSSALPRMCEDQTKCGSVEVKDRHNYKITVSEDETEERTDDSEDGIMCRQHKHAAAAAAAAADDDDDDYIDEDYKEVVVKPRHLNEVTSLTDKTSPWTSILSDPDLVSLVSLEEPEDVMRQISNRETHDADNKHKSDRQEETDSFSGSTGDTSDTERDGKRTPQALDERPAEEADSCQEESQDTCPSPVMHLTTDTQDAACFPDNQDLPFQPSVPVEIPNFFLPSQQLEASMRAIRLAPSFSQSTADPGQDISTRRGPRQRPHMSPPSMKKETERIAKIFAAHFDAGR
ncbi:C2 domain-containing protein 3 isoform X2 [Betta splendens]|uniref:C2 domain-containing protein 3 isoform X2 n=1 Tax=Betta splendens TaxID=158456 RepID=A0A6P7P505_BETSP|nr:C2 domain-containing protein 3 isoform X2 [Betta splendens]